MNRPVKEALKQRKPEPWAGPAPVVRYLLNHYAYFVPDQNYWQSKINAVRGTLDSSFGFTDTDYIKVPTLFKDTTRDAEAYIPNMVNSLIANGKIVIPKPFGPVENGTDAFEIELTTRIPGGVEVFVDDWDMYHAWGGEIHCGTNVRRSIPMFWWWFLN
jgi:protein-arginine deiminase